MHFPVEAAFWVGLRLECVNYRVDVMHIGPYLNSEFDKRTINYLVATFSI